MAMVESARQADDAIRCGVIQSLVIRSDEWSLRKAASFLSGEDERGKSDQ